MNRRVILCVFFLMLCGPRVFSQGYTGQSHPVLKTPSLVHFEEGHRPAFDQWKEVYSKITGFSKQTTFRVYREFPDELGQVHYRVRQYYGNIPLDFGETVIHTLNGRILSINGEFIPETYLQGNKRINAEQALHSAKAFMPSRLYYWEDPAMESLLRQQTGREDTSWLPRPELVYCPEQLLCSNPHQLAYRVRLMSLEPADGKDIYVDARTGQVLAAAPVLLDADVKGTAVTAFSGTRDITTDSTASTSYRLREKRRGKGIETMNMQKGTSYAAAVDFTDTDNTWNNVNANKDEVATDAHWGAEKTYDYFDSLHNRNSFDGAGAKIISYVHYSNNYANAFWNGSFMTYGDGNGSSWKPLTSIDVCGHEIAHAVTTYSANLVYSYESGALNESFSDIFGNAIERWARKNKYNWKVGEDFTTSGNGIRDMSNPNPYNHPKFYKGVKWYTGAGDNGGVHTNSGVQNYWFYLITDGVSGTNEVSNAFDIDSLGVVDASRIAYRNLTVYLTKNSQYADARTYSIMSAADLFGQCSRHVVAVTNAWWACGVGAKYDSATVKAGFSGDTLVCQPGDSVRFKNLSSNFKTCLWTFGDGQTSAGINPKHAYNQYGTYTVKLVATGCFKNKKDSLTRVNYIKVDSSADICDGALIPYSGTDSVIKCRGYLYDDGGEGNYGALKQVNLKVIAPGADSIRLRFLVLDYEKGYDSVVLFKTNTLQSNKVGKFTGNTLPFSGGWITVAANTLWLRQYSDQLVEGKGFKIEFYSFRKPLSLDLGKDTLICSGDSVWLDPNVGGGYASDYYFRWNTAQTTRNIWAKPAANTVYKLILSDACTREFTEDSVKVTLRPLLDVKLAADTTICTGQTVRLTASASGGLTSGYTYTWNQGLSGATSHTVQPTSTTLYRVVLRDGCSVRPDTAYQTVHVRAPLKTTFSVPGSLFCIGKAVNISVSGTGGDSTNYSFTWNQGLGTGKSKTVTLTDTTWFRVTLKDACTVKAGVDSIRLYTYPPLQLNMPNDTVICRGSSVTLSPTMKGGLGAGFSYKWKSGEITRGITKTPAGPTTFILTGSDGCSPDVTDSVRVNWLAPLQLSRRRDTTLCNGQTLRPGLVPSGGRSSSYAIAWNLGGLTGGNPLITPSTGTTFYQAVLSDGCTVKSDSSGFSITGLTPLSVNVTATPPLICAGDSSRLDLTFSGGKSAGYTWTLDGVPVSSKIIRLRPSATAAYTVVLNDGCSTPASGNATVTISPAAAATLNVDTKWICSGSVVQFSYTSPDAAKVKWFFSPGDSVDGTSGPVGRLYAKAGKYTAWARVTTSAGCSGLITLTDTITVEAFPVAGFTADPAVTDVENTTVKFTDKSVGGTSGSWDFGDGGTSSMFGDQTHQYPADSGRYQVMQVVTRMPGCSDTAFGWVRVKDVYSLFMPTVFSPDGNNLNDVFLPYGRGIQSGDFQIFNRWGEKILSTTDLSQGWNGRTSDGEMCPQGIYIYRLNLIDTNGLRHKEEGTVLLLR